jgi:hypothetical protein
MTFTGSGFYKNALKEAPWAIASLLRGIVCHVSGKNPVKKSSDF